MTDLIRAVDRRGCRLDEGPLQQALNCENFQRGKVMLDRLPSVRARQSEKTLVNELDGAKYRRSDLQCHPFSAGADVVSKGLIESFCAVDLRLLRDAVTQSPSL